MLHASELPGDSWIPNPEFQLLVGPGGGGGTWESGFVADALIWGPTLTPKSDTAWGRSTPTHWEKPATLITLRRGEPHLCLLMTQVPLSYESLNFRRTRWKSPLENQLNYHLQTIWHVLTTHLVFSFLLREPVPHSWEKSWKRIPSSMPFLKTELLRMAIIVLTSELSLTFKAW